MMSDALNDALNGTGSFPAKLENVTQMAALYPNYVQIVTSKRSGIKTITDLKETCCHRRTKLRGGSECTQFISGLWHYLF